MGLNEMNPNDLRRGHRFRTRMEMSKALGGTPYRGISYAALSQHVAVVSGSPAKERFNAFNYKNWWSPTDPTNEYFYYGEWHGCQDMSMTGGNAAIADPSKTLLLFMFDGADYVFEGQFTYVDHILRP